MDQAHGGPGLRPLPARAEGAQLRGLPCRAGLRAPLGADGDRGGQRPLHDGDPRLHAALLQRRVRARPRPPRRRRAPAPRALHRGRSLRRGPERGRRTVPRRQRRPLRARRPSRRYADGPEHRRLDASIGEPGGVRDRHVAHRGAEPARRDRPPLRAHESGREAQRMTPNRYLDDERIAIQASARRFAMEEVLPVANECDPRKADIPASLLRRIAAMGYFGIMIDAEYGGMGKGVFEYALITEELARAWMSVASII